LIEELFNRIDVLFLVGHNNTMTELAEYLTGAHLGNVPTCGIVAVEYADPQGFSAHASTGKIVFFDFPKNTSGSEILK
jgi:phosphohistidine phosphatase